MTREQYVSRKLQRVLPDVAPEVVEAIAVIACLAVEIWEEKRLILEAEALSARLDHNIDQAHAYRDGIEDTTAYLRERAEFWETD